MSEQETQLTADEIRVKVDEILEAAGVSYSVINCGIRVVRPEKDKCRCPGDYSPPQRQYDQDAWRVSFKKGWGGQPVDFDYFTGIGCRQKPAITPRPAYTPGTLAHEAWLKSWKPIAPKAADVLYSLVLDGQAMHMSFYDWASDFGYDTDSLKAFETYNACCKSGRDLRVVFTSEQVRAIEEAVRDL